MTTVTGTGVPLGPGSPANGPVRTRMRVWLTDSTFAGLPPMVTVTGPSKPLPTMSTVSPPAELPVLGSRCERTKATSPMVTLVEARMVPLSTTRMLATPAVVPGKKKAVPTPLTTSTTVVWGPPTLPNPPRVVVSVSCPVSGTPSERVARTVTVVGAVDPAATLTELELTETTIPRPGGTGGAGTCRGSLIVSALHPANAASSSPATVNRNHEGEFMARLLRHDFDRGRRGRRADDIPAQRPSEETEVHVEKDHRGARLRVAAGEREVGERSGPQMVGVEEVEVVEGGAATRGDGTEDVLYEGSRHARPAVRPGKGHLVGGDLDVHQRAGDAGRVLDHARHGDRVDLEETAFGRGYLDRQRAEVTDREQHPAGLLLVGALLTAGESRQQAGRGEDAGRLGQRLPHMSAPLPGPHSRMTRGVMKISSSSFSSMRRRFLNRCPSNGMLASPGTRSWPWSVETS